MPRRANSAPDGASEVTQTPQEAQGVENIEAERGVSIKGTTTVSSVPAGDRVVLTSEPKRSADKSSSPGGEAYPEDPPVRTTRPDVPIVESMASGAGEHVPPDPDVYTPDGRVRDIVEQ